MALSRNLWHFSPTHVLRATALLFLSAFMACRNSDPLAGNSARTSPVTPPFRVTVDPTPYASLSAAERAAVQADAIRQILQRIPPEHREQATALLQKDITQDHISTGSGGTVVSGFAGSNDPEIARLLGVVASVRAASNQALRVASRSPNEGAPRDPRERVYVTVVFDAARVDAPVALYGPAYHWPLLVVGRDATAGELRVGLRIAGQLVRDFGPDPAREYRAEIDPPSASEIVPPEAARLLAAIQTSPARDIPNLGRLPALEVATYPKH